MSRLDSYGERLPGALGTALALALTWFILTEGRADAWLIGIPAIVVACLVVLRTGMPFTARLRPAALPGFVAYFAVQSVRGGIDVARRAMSRSIAIEPAVIEHQWRLPPGPARTLATVALNLMPGTLAIGERKEHLIVHVLDANVPVALDELEAHVAGLLGLGLALPERTP